MTAVRRFIDHLFSLNQFVSMVLGYAAMLISLMSAQFTYFTLSPLSVWIEYESIELAKIPERGKPLHFYSYVTVRKSSAVSWRDNLRCDLFDGVGYRSFSVQAFTSGATEVKPLKRVAWTYVEAVPDTKAECYLRSVATGLLPYGIQKVAVTKSDIFLIP